MLEDYEDEPTRPETPWARRRSGTQRRVTGQTLVCQPARSVAEGLFERLQSEERRLETALSSYPSGTNDHTNIQSVLGMLRATMNIAATVAGG